MILILNTIAWIISNIVWTHLVPCLTYWLLNNLKDINKRMNWVFICTYNLLDNTFYLLTTYVIFFYKLYNIIIELLNYQIWLSTNTKSMKLIFKLTFIFFFNYYFNLNKIWIDIIFDYYIMPQMLLLLQYCSIYKKK